MNFIRFSKLDIFQNCYRYLFAYYIRGKGQWHSRVLCTRVYIYAHSVWCTRKRVASLIVHFAGAKCTGQMRQMRVRIRRPSIPSLYYQTMQLPIGSAGSEFSRRVSLLARALRPRRRRGITVLFFFIFILFFRNVDLVWRLSENDGRGTRSVNMIKGARDSRFVFFYYISACTIKGRLYRLLSVYTALCSRRARNWCLYFYWKTFYSSFAHKRQLFRLVIGDLRWQ